MPASKYLSMLPLCVLTVKAIIGVLLKRAENLKVSCLSFLVRDSNYHTDNCQEDFLEYEMAPWSRRGVTVETPWRCQFPYV